MNFDYSLMKALGHIIESHNDGAEAKKGGGK